MVAILITLFCFAGFFITIKKETNYIKKMKVNSMITIFMKLNGIIVLLLFWCTCWYYLIDYVFPNPNYCIEWKATHNIKSKH